MAEKLVCSSCKTSITVDSAARFKCPNCGQTEIIRCKHCRKMAAPYVCPQCSFKGPN